MLFFYQFAILKVTVQWEGMWLKGEAALTAGSRLTAPRVHLGTWGGHCHQPRGRAVNLMVRTHSPLQRHHRRHLK